MNVNGFRFRARFLPAALMVCLLPHPCPALPSWLWPFEGNSNKLAGEWKSRFGVWTLRSDDTFELDLNSDGQADLSGVYHLRGSRMSISASGGTVPSGCDNAGIYRVKLRKDTLTFVPVQDDCTERVLMLAAKWRRKALADTH
jgi:hypothetical protein